MKKKQTITIKSPAKINIFLKIVGKRSDGYHELETVFQMISLCDQITLELAEKGIEIFSNSKEMPLDKSNLSFKAAESLLKYTGLSKGVKITINKKIPIAAGLGGGSSNAATTLFGCNLLWNAGLNIEELFNLAKPLGADVPFFLKGPTAIGAGIGDILKTIPSGKKMWIILINPNISISSAWAYSKLGLTTKSNTIKIKGLLSNIESVEDLWHKGVNDLETPVLKHYPIIKEIKQKLIAAGATSSLMSGSGSTVFGVFKDLSTAELAFNKLNKSEWSVFLSETITDSSLNKVFLPQRRKDAEQKENQSKKDFKLSASAPLRQR